MSFATSSSPELSSRRPLLVGAGSALLLILPLGLVEWLPSTDLPQLVAQLRLLGEVGETGSGLSVQWWHPNKLGYLPLGAGWGLAGLLGQPALAGRIGLALVILAWVAATHYLAAARSLESSQALLASLLVFNVSFHWGFVNFLLGLPLFLLFVQALDQREERDARARDRPGRRAGLGLLLLAAALYAAHVLWLAMVLLYMGLDAIRRRNGRLLLTRLAWVSPSLVATFIWYARFRETGVDQRLFWGQPPWWRLHPTWWVESLFGGLRGSVEIVVATALLAWLGIGLAQSRARPCFGFDRKLLSAALLLLAAAFFLPAVYHHTILFAARWLAPGLALLILAAPAPNLTPWIRSTAAWLLAASLIVSLAAGWMRFEQEELGGFAESLDAMGEIVGTTDGDLRLLGLDFVRESPTIDGFPYHHLPVYAQVLYGIDTQRTFADDPASLVVFEELPHIYPWTDRLDWKPQSLRASDFDHFDLFLAHGPDELHHRFLADPRLDPVDNSRDGSATRPWRLYRIQPKGKATGS